MSGVGAGATPPAGKVRVAMQLLVLAVLVGPTVASIELATGHSVDAALTHGLIYGVGYSIALMLVNLHRRRERLRGALRHLTLDQRRTADRASRTGPVPGDPEVRAEALRLNRALKAGEGGGETAVLVVLVLGALACILAGFLVSPWWWPPAAVLIITVGQSVRVGRRSLAQRARLEQAGLLDVGSSATDRSTTR